jgi:hypothetical protein
MQGHFVLQTPYHRNPGGDEQTLLQVSDYHPLGGSRDASQSAASVHNVNA